MPRAIYEYGQTIINKEAIIPALRPESLNFFIQSGYFAFIDLAPFAKVFAKQKSPLIEITFKRLLKLIL